MQKKHSKETFNTITNIIILLILVFGGIGYSVGFHFPYEILPGQFANGDYSFNGSLGIGTNSPTANLEVIGTVSFPNRSAVRVHSNAAQSYTSSTWANISFEIEDIDTQNEFNLSTNTFTAKTTGIYSVSGQIIYDGLGTFPSSLYASINKNGVSYSRRFTLVYTGTNAMYVPINDLIKLNAGDNLTLAGYFDSGNKPIGEAGSFLAINRIN